MDTIIKVKTDANGFLVGGTPENWKSAKGTWDDIRREVRAIRRMLEGRAGSRSAAEASPTRRMRSGVAGVSSTDMAMAVAAAAAVAARPVAGARRRGIPVTATQGVPANRGANGRFIKGTGAAVGAKAAPPGAPPADDEDEKKKKKGSGRFGRAAAELGQLADAQTSPLVAAAREVGEVVVPIGRAFGKLFRGDPEKKKLSWFKRIFETLKALPTKIGDRVAIRVPGSQAAGGGMGGGLLSGGAALAGRLISRTPLLAGLAAAAGGLYSDRALASGGDAAAGERVANAGRTAGKVGGIVLGAAAGLALGGPIGAAMGAVVGPRLVFSLTEILTPMLSAVIGFIANAAGKVAGVGRQVFAGLRNFGNIDFGGEGAGGSRANPANAGNDVVAMALGKTASPGSDYMNKLAYVESGNNPLSSSQRDKFLATNGASGSTASGRYQFLDGTFAEQLAANGGKIAGAGALVNVAKAYLADKAEPLAKARNPAYKAMFDAKLNPAVADPLAEMFTAENRAKLRAKGITNPTDAQLYSVHLTGGTKAALAMAASPNAPVASAFSERALSGNAGLLGSGTVGAAFANMDARLNRAPAMPKFSTRPIAQMDVAPPMRLPDAPKPQVPVGSNTGQSNPGPVQEVSQNMNDRNLAHIATGGIGGMGKWGM